MVMINLVISTLLISKGVFGIAPDNHTVPSTIAPPRLRSPILSTSHPIEIPSPGGSPVGRFRPMTAPPSATPSDFSRAGVDGSFIEPSLDFLITSLNKAESELRATWEIVKDWDASTVSGSTYDEIVETIGRQFERIRSHICFNFTLLQETADVEQGIKAILEPPKSSRDIRKGLSPAINMHFEFLLGEFNRTKTSVCGTIPPVEQRDSDLDDDQASSCTSSDDDDDDDLHFRMDE